MIEFQEPRIRLELIAGDFLVKIAETKEEFLRALRLRHQVFYVEKPGISPKGDLDWDEFDGLCDHLIVVHRSTQDVVGTYRLNCSSFNSKFEVAREFPIEALVESCDCKVEMSCACVKDGYRRGPVIALLWRGLSEYVRVGHAQMLFGVTSFYDFTVEKLADCFLFFEREGLLLQDFQLHPHETHMLPGFEKVLKERAKQNGTSFSWKDLPALCRAYLIAGAKIAGLPSYDIEFGCFNYLTVLHLQDLEEKIRHHYFERTSLPGLIAERKD